MEKLLNGVGIGTRVMTITLVPLVLAVAFAFVAAMDARRTATEAKTIENIASFAPKVSALVHELQKERGRSAGFIGSSLQSDLGDLVDRQREDTDRSLGIFRSAMQEFNDVSLGADFTAVLNAATVGIGVIEKQRQDISQGNTSVPEMASYYTATITKLLDIIKFMTINGSDPEIMQALTGYIGILEAKERAGLERAMGNAGFNAGAFPAGVYNRFVGLISEQTAFLSIFRSFSSAGIVALYDSTVRGEAVTDVERMRDLAISTRGALDSGDPIPTNWFSRITAKIDLMKVVEDRSNSEIRKIASGKLEAANAAFWTMSITFLIGAIAILSMAYAVFTSVTNPLKRLKSSMEDLSGGDLEVVIPCSDYGSEIGKMAVSVAKFKESSIERLLLEIETKRAEIAHLWREEETREEVAKQAEVQAAHQQAAEEAEQRRLNEAMQALAAKFDREVGSVITELMQAAQSLESTSGAMIDQAEENEQCGSEAASASHQTSSNVQTVASAAEELNSSVDEINRQVAESSQISSEAVSQSDTAAATVSELAESSRKIEGVLGLISEIAEQTNLLALNATIEAARAGEAGKGFAVVAHEVKALADQTAGATEEIATQIRMMQSVSDNVSHVVGSIRGIVQQTNEISSAIASSVEQQSAATSEISRSMQEASTGADQVMASVSKVQQVAKQTKGSSADVKSSSATLMRHCEGLQAAVQGFLSELTLNKEVSVTQNREAA